MRASILAKASHQSEAEENYTDERCFILETWNHECDPDVSVARARVAPGVVTARHALAVDERYVVVKGKGLVELEGTDSREVSAGDVVLIPAGTTQRIRNLGEEDFIFLCICTPRFEPKHYEDRE